MIVLLEFWIGFLIGSSSVALIIVKMLQRHSRRITTIREQSERIEHALRDLKIAKEALSETFNQIYHKDIFPEVCRGEGIFTVTETYIDEAITNADLASRPNHYEYNKLVKKALVEAKEWTIKGRSEMVKLKNRFQQIMNKYQDYQN